MPNRPAGRLSVGADPVVGCRGAAQAVRTNLGRKKLVRTATPYLLMIPSQASINAAASSRA